MKYCMIYYIWPCKHELEAKSNTAYHYKEKCRKYGFSSAEVSGVGRRWSPTAVVGLVVRRRRRRGCVGGGGELHHAARVHDSGRPPRIRIQYEIGEVQLLVSQVLWEPELDGFSEKINYRVYQHHSFCSQVDYRLAHLVAEHCLLTSQSSYTTESAISLDT